MIVMFEVFAWTYVPSVSSFVRCLFMSFAYFLIGQFFLLHFENSLYIVDMTSLSDPSLTNIFS